MKRIQRLIITLGIGSLLALCSAAITYSTPAMGGTLGAGTFLVLQTTAPPQQKDLSVIGSTDGIVVMGVLIALIILVPIMLRRASWMESR